MRKGAGPGRVATAAVLAALVLIWSTTWAVIRVGLRGLPPLTGVALRFTLASAALLGLAAFLRVPLGRDPVERRLWPANALLTFAIPYGVLYWAEQVVPSGLAAVLFATFPLIVAVIAHFVLPGERLTPKGIVGILTGFAGVAVIFSEDFQALGGSKVGLAAAVLLIAPLSASFGSVLIKKWGSGVHPLSTAAVPMGIAALVTGTLALVLEHGRPVHLDTPSVLAVLYLAIIGSAVPFTLYFWLLQHQTATGMSLINYAIPVIAVLVGTVFLKEPFTLRILVGAALVLAGVGIALRTRKEA